MTTFRFRILFENDFEKLRQRSIKLNNVEINRKRILHKRHHESFKNDFLNKSKKSTKRITKLKNETKKKFNQKRRKINLF